MKLFASAILCYLFFIPLQLFSQHHYFEGSITYTITVQAKNDKVDTVVLKKAAGSGNTLFFKQGNFFHTYNGGSFTEDIYRTKDNKIYIKTVGNDTIFWISCAIAGDKILKLEFTPKKEKILGILCDQLVIHYKNRTETDYYNSSLFELNPEWMKNFLFDEEYLVDEKEKAIYLKHVVEYPNFITTQTAISFKRKKINNLIFELPANAILKEKK